MSPSESIAPSATGPPRDFVLWLAFNQLISWGTLYYTFALLFEHFERDLAISRVDAAFALSLALLAEGIGGFVVGRLIDAGRARVVMSGGSLLAACGLLALSFVQARWQLYAAWIVIGVAMSATLYQPAFSVLIRRFPKDFRRAIITLTIIGGLSSTVFIPLTAWLISTFGWRHAVGMLALVHVLVCVPIHVFALRFEPPARVSTPSAAMAELGGLTRRPPFWGLAVFFLLFTGIASAMAGHLVSILRERQLPEAWVIALPASIGLLQVAGRLLLFVTEKYVDVHRANRWILLLLPAALTVLALGLQSTWAALLYALLYGLANGMITVVKATAMATYVSQPRAASLNGLLAFPTAIARAAAPSLLAVMWTATGDYALGLAVFTLLAGVSAAAFWWAQRQALRAV
jgi:MFS family permease